MKKTEAYNKWLNAAYHEFAKHGPDFSLKALSEKTALPRATLYYHFDDKEHLSAYKELFQEPMLNSPPAPLLENLMIFQERGAEVRRTRRGELNGSQRKTGWVRNCPLNP